jgi:hypothetical protein
MNLQELVQQYHGTTLPKLVEKQVNSLKQETLVQAVRGTFDNFPAELRPQLDAFTQDYLQHWFGPHILTADLGDIFIDTVKDIKSMANEAGISLDDERVFDLFNIMVMKVSHFAHSRRAFRKDLGIKKRWFSRAV